MTKLEMWTIIFSDSKKTLRNQNILEELYEELTWKETKKLYVVLNWFRIHDKHRFLQYRALVFYAGDIRSSYDAVLNRYKKELRLRGKRV